MHEHSRDRMGVSGLLVVALVVALLVTAHPAVAAAPLEPEGDPLPIEAEASDPVWPGRVLSVDGANLVRIDTPQTLSSGDWVEIVSPAADSDRRRVIGFGQVLTPTQVRVESKNLSELLRPGCRLRRINRERRDQGIPGRLDLLIPDRVEVSSSYKPLILLGVPQGQAAAVLAPREWFVGSSLAGFGLAPGWMVYTQPAWYLERSANVGTKLRLYSSPEYTFSLGTSIYRELGPRRAPEAQTFFDVDAYLDVYTSNRFVGFWKMSLRSERPFSALLAPLGQQRPFSLELQTLFAVIFDNWNRLIFGPRVNVQEQTLGGYVAYHFIYDRFQWSVGLTNNDFTRWSDRNQLQLAADVAWRW